MSPAMKTTLEDELKNLDIVDFLGGLNSQKDLQDMELNESPDCLNVYAQPGRLLGRKGSLNQVTMPAAISDGIMYMYDALGTRRIYVWNGGNLYETTFGAATAVASACYNAGERVCHTTLNGIVYYSDGIIPIRMYDPATSTDSDITPSGATGSIAIPSANVLITYTGALVAGACVAAGVFEPQQFRWCNINDPTTWLGVNVQAVGQGLGGQINAMSNMGVSDAGVSPFRALWVGKSREGIFGYQGALGQLQEFLIPVPSGVQDGASAAFIPSPDGRAMVAWLGTDHKIWYSNGVTASELSGNIRDELAAYVQNQIATKAKPLFCAVNNAENFHYVLDCGDNVQYVYDYQNKYWTRYEGWPSGYWASGADALGSPAIFFASNVDTKYGQANVGDVEFDGTTPIEHYWKTGYLNGGNSDRLKDWIQAFVAFKTEGLGQVNVDFIEGPTPTPDTRLNGSFGIGISADGGNTLVWDVGNWDDQDWSGNPSDLIKTYRVRVRMACLVSIDSEFYALIPYETFRAADCQITIGQSAVAKHFEILGLRLQFIWRGYAQVGQVAYTGLVG